MQVRGFGDGLTRAVLDWKASCERRFTFNPAAAVSNADRMAVKTKFATRKTTVEKLLAAAPAQLRKFAQEATSQLATLQPRLESAAERLAQAQADHAELSGRPITFWSSLSAPAKFAIVGLAALAFIIFASLRNSPSPAPSTTSYPTAPTATTAAIPSSAKAGRASGPDPGKQIATVTPARVASSTASHQAKAGTPSADEKHSDSTAGVNLNRPGFRGGSTL